MTNLTISPISDRQRWNSTIQLLPRPHILQTWEWGEFKARTTGWTPQRLLFHSADGELLAAASLLTRRIGPLRVMYIPKGPIFATDDTATISSILAYLKEMAARQLAIWLKIDPDIVLATGLPPEATEPDDKFPHQPDPFGTAFAEKLKAQGWRFSPDQVQFRNTMTLDLTQSEDDLLADMNQSTRRKIRLADKRGVTVRPAQSTADFQTLYDLYSVTGDRQDFTIRPADYYLDLWQSFIKAGLGQALIAEFEGKPLAGLVLFHFGQKAWYFYGMSSNQHRDKQPTYALQWAAIRYAKKQGYQVYDWWGAPNEFTEDDPMWGVYQFKRGFGGQVIRHVGAWDAVPYPPLYWAYTRLMPFILRHLRRTSEAD
jgi:lipid II:glycine glycyltransferase (peptidoglycan interpeptide bridge formation enzyme)